MVSFGYLLLAIAGSIPAFSQTPPPPADLTPEKRADIFMARKMYREAVESYREGDLQSAVIWNKIGIAYHQMQQLDLAQKSYERSMKLNASYAEASNNIGTIQYAKKNYRRAINWYNRALKLTPKSASIYSNLGTAYFARKKYEQADQAYQTALSLDPEVFEHRSAYGTMLQERSVEEKAKFHFHLGKTYAKNGRFDRAIQYLRMALEEGFKERDKLMEAPEFAKLRDTAEFKELMAYQPRVL